MDEGTWYELWDLEHGNLLADDDTSTRLRRLRREFFDLNPNADKNEMVIFKVDLLAGEEERVIVWGDDILSAAEQIIRDAREQ